jgi:hypothetical protein
MPDQVFYTKEAAITKATAVKALYATSKMRLVKGPFVPNSATTKSVLTANEADFDGYTAGGYAITAYTGPTNFPSGGQVLQSPLIPVAYSTPSDPPVTNQITGFWIETSTGSVIIVGSYDPPKPLNAVGDAFQWLAQDVEGVTAAAPNPS